MKIDKEEFKSLLEGNLRVLFREEIAGANKQQRFQALAVTVRDYIMDAWLATSKKFKEENVKFVYYMSMEFLMGRALGNSIISLCAEKEIREALDELGIDLNEMEDEEPDAALGNGGLGRLAACFLDSLSS